MNNTLLKTRFPKLSTRRLMRIGLPIILLLGIGIALLVSPLTTTRQAETKLVDSELIEEVYGIRIKWIAVVANGGGLDFRYIVVNPDKANEFMHDPDYRPILIPEGSDIEIEPHKRIMNMVFIAGSAYHILYSNPGGAVKSGTPVIVQFGDYQLDPIIAQ